MIAQAQRRADPAELLSSILAMAPDAAAQFLETASDETLELVNNYAQYMHVEPLEARKHLIRFTRYMNPDPEDRYNPNKSLYQVAPHHQLLGDALMEVIEGKNLRLAISMPPQHGKSTLATRNFLSYHVGRFPWKHLLMGTYNQTFAEEFGDDVRTIINSEQYARVWPEVALRKGSKAKDHMVTTEGGKLSFLGRGGSGTGRPADGLLIDDPLKDAKEAESKTIRDDCWNWFTRVANSRCHSLTWQILIMTRWSDDDLIARLTDPKNPHYDAEVAKDWTVINLPAILDNEELAAALGKRVGEALWPERFPLKLLETSRRMDAYGFNALYMGRPTPPEGAFYKEHMLCTYDSMDEFPRNCNMYMTGDLAVTPEMRADRSAVGLWGLDENDELWLHPNLFWDRRASDDVVEEIIDRAKDYKVIDAFFEKGQLDRAVGPFLEKRMSERKAFFGITKLSPAGSKALRSTSIRGRMSQRKVHFPRFAPWWPNAKEELLKFTGTGDDKADDFCDMIALAGQAMDSYIRTSGASTSNVIQMPKVGTLGWTTWAHRQQQRISEQRRQLRGM